MKCLCGHDKTTHDTLNRCFFDYNCDCKGFTELPQPAKFHPSEKGTVCECGWGHGSKYDLVLELQHRIEHLEGLWQNLVKPTT